MRLVVACRVLGIHEGVMVGQVDLAMEQVGGRGESHRDGGKHVGHALVDDGPVRDAIEPLARRHLAQQRMLRATRTGHGAVLTIPLLYLSV